MSVRSGLSIVFCFVVLILVSGCGTLYRGFNQDLSITTIPSGATAKIGDQECVTPCKLRVWRRTDSVTITKDGQTAIFEVDRHKSIWFFWDMFFGLFILPPIDCALGGVYDLNPVKVDLYKERVLLYPNQYQYPYPYQATPGQPPVQQAMQPAPQPAVQAPAPAAAPAVAPIPRIQSDIDELPGAKASQNNNAYAIVIGIEQYRQNLPRANYATHDAETVAKYLTNVLGYPQDNVITLLNDKASKSDFEKYFDQWLVDHAQKESTVFIYYAGHGSPDAKNGTGYFLPYDGDPEFLSQTGYSLKRMYAALGKLPAKKIMVVLDSSFSGAGGRSVLGKGAQPQNVNLKQGANLPQNVAVMSASLGHQASSPYDQKGHGLFTYFLLKGLKTEDVVKTDGSIKLRDLFSYVKAYVQRTAKKEHNNDQSPILIEASGTN